MSQKYTLYTDQIGNNKKDDFAARFTFEAKNQADATHKAEGWARYQGFTYKEVEARVATGEEIDWMTHNEYVARW